MTWLLASVGQAYLFSLAVTQDVSTEAWLDRDRTKHF